MKHYIKNIVTMAVLLLATAAAWAGDVTVVKTLNGAVADAAGTVTQSVANSQCTLTVTPAEGNYIESVAAVKKVSGNIAESRRNAPAVGSEIEVTKTSTSTDPSEVATYEFAMPTEEYDVEVTVNFKGRTSIEGYTLSLEEDEDGYTYNGAEFEPNATVSKGQTELVLNTDYTVAYTNNVNAGTPDSQNPPTVTVTGKGKYMGTKSTYFTIGKADFGDVEIEAIPDQDYTGGDLTPTLTVTYESNPVSADDYTVSYTRNGEPTTEVKDGGSYTVTLTSTHNNFSEGTVSANFKITRAYDLWVGGTQVTSDNATNINGGTTGIASFNAETNTLTLNGTSLCLSSTSGSAIKSGLQNLTVVLVGSPNVWLNGESSSYAFEGTVEGAKVTFTTNGTTAGSMSMEAGYNRFFGNITPVYQNGLIFFNRDSNGLSYYKAVIKAAPWTGSGTEEDPFQISTATDLTRLATEVNNGVTINHQFKLMDNIDCTEAGTMSSIGNSYNKSFKGVFDGNKKMISYLTSTHGLFGYIADNCIIKDLSLDRCTVTGSSSDDCVAGLVAQVRSSSAVISNCHVYNSNISSGDNANITTVGGIVGYMYSGEVTGCSVKNTSLEETNLSRTYAQSVGGIVGHTYYGSKVNNCSFTFGNDSITTILNSTSGDVNMYTGAIIGYIESSTTLSNNTYHPSTQVVTQTGNDDPVTLKGNAQRGIGYHNNTYNEDVFENDGAVLTGVKKILNINANTPPTNGQLVMVSGYYNIDSNGYTYALPYVLSNEETVVRKVADVDYDAPTAVIRDSEEGAVEASSSEGIDEATGADYTEWTIQMPNSDVTFTITDPINLEREGRVLTIDDFDFSGEPVAITTITTKKNDDATTEIALAAGTDFTITKYQDEDGTDIGTTAPRNAGIYRVVIQGMGICVGDTAVVFTINAIAANISGEDETVTYNAEAQAYSKGSITNGTLVVTYYDSEEARSVQSGGSTEAPSDAATYYVQLTQGNTNYASEPVNVTFTINPAVITEVTLVQTSLECNDEEQTVEIASVKAGDLFLTPDDYYVDGAEATSVGTYTVTVTGTGNFTGEATAYFTVGRALGISFVGDNSWATYFATEDLNTPEDLTAYVVSDVNETSGVVTVSAVDYIPAETAVLLQRADGAAATGYVATAYTDQTTDVISKLEGTVEGISVEDITEALVVGGAVYVLFNDTFKRATSGTIPARRCFLILGEYAASRLIIFDETGTAIGTLTLDSVNSNDGWYSVDGLKMNGEPRRAGLYIKNGKKVIVTNKK